MAHIDSSSKLFRWLAPGLAFGAIAIFDLGLILFDLSAPKDKEPSDDAVAVLDHAQMDASNPAKASGKRASGKSPAKSKSMGALRSGAAGSLMTHPEVPAGAAEPKDEAALPTARKSLTEFVRSSGLKKGEPDHSREDELEAARKRHEEETERARQEIERAAAERAARMNPPPPEPPAQPPAQPPATPEPAAPEQPATQQPAPEQPAPEQPEQPAEQPSTNNATAPAEAPAE